MKKSVRGYALVVAAACGWGMWPLVLRTAERIAPIPAAVESALLMAVMMVVTGPLSLRDRVRRKATRAEWLLVGWTGIADALNAYFFFNAYQRTSVAIAVLTHYLTPLFVAMTAPLFLGERPTRRAYAAVALGLGGLVLLLEPWHAAARPTDVVGAAFGAASAVFYASNVLAARRLAGAFSASEQMFFHCLTALPLLLVLVPRGAYAAANLHALAILALGSLGPGTLASLAFVQGLRTVPASRASPLTLIEPLVAVLIGIGVYGETIRGAGIVGGALILYGAWLVVAPSSRDEGEARG